MLALALAGSILNIMYSTLHSVHKKEGKKEM